MAYVFSSLSDPKHGSVKVEYIRFEACQYLRPLTHSYSIVFVLAIGAEPRKTWARATDSVGLEHRRLDHV